jgi:hypothetical protein
VVLEHLGTPDARQILERVADGEAEALPTKAARESLDRLKGKAKRGLAKIATPQAALLRRVRPAHRVDHFIELCQESRTIPGRHRCRAAGHGPALPQLVHQVS